jgi:hypothetical protein
MNRTDFESLALAWGTEEDKRTTGAKTVSGLNEIRSGHMPNILQALPLQPNCSASDDLVLCSFFPVVLISL